MGSYKDIMKQRGRKVLNPTLKGLVVKIPVKCPMCNQPYHAIVNVDQMHVNLLLPSFDRTGREILPKS